MSIFNKSKLLLLPSKLVYLLDLPVLGNSINIHSAAHIQTLRAVSSLFLPFQSTRMSYQCHLCDVQIIA